MITQTGTTTAEQTKPQLQTESPQHAKLRHLYQQTGEDYTAWSPNYNMHFGYWRWGLLPWRLEPMLEELTLQVLRRLHVPMDHEARIADLGCGAAATTRAIALRRPRWNFEAVTVVDWQIQKARELALRDNVAAQVRFHQDDYCQTTLPDASLDAAWAMESACHAPGLAKDDLIAEAARTLKPGARLVVADLFQRHNRPMPRPLRWTYRKVCDAWAVPDFPELGPFVTSLWSHGFTNVEIEDISFRIAPSAAHVPAVTAGFLLRELRRDGLDLGAARWGHIQACVLGPILGALRNRFAYCLITATKQ